MHDRDLFERNRENFFREQLMIYKFDQVNFWKKVNELLGTTSTPSIDGVLEYGTNRLLDLNTSVEEIYKYFASIGEGVSRETDNLSHEILDEEVTETEMNYFNRLSVSRFLEIVSELKLSINQVGFLNSIVV